MTVARLKRRRFGPVAAGELRLDDGSIPPGFNVGLGGGTFRRRISSFRAALSALSPVTSARKCTIMSSRSAGVSVRESGDSDMTRWNHAARQTATHSNPIYPSHNAASATAVRISVQSRIICRCPKLSQDVEALRTRHAEMLMPSVTQRDCGGQRGTGPWSMRVTKPVAGGYQCACLVALSYQSWPE